MLQEAGEEQATNRLLAIKFLEQGRSPCERKRRKIMDCHYLWMSIQARIKEKAPGKISKRRDQRAGESL